MKRLLIYILTAVVSTACSKSTAEGPADEEAGPQLERIVPVLDGIEAKSGPATRAVGDYAVNHAALDPTHTLTGRESWILHATIYKGTAPYAYGEGTCVYNSPGYWIPDPDDIYFPNYLRQRAAFTLYPAGWTAGDPIDLDQSGTGVLLGNDILMQNSAVGTPYITINPAHEPTVQMKHANSMLDFILLDTDLGQISTVTVTVGTDTYIPYQVAGSQQTEYMLIIPTGVTDFTVYVQTSDGAGYDREISITNGSVENTCYCFTLVGLQLELSAITVSNWLTGEAVAGDYTIVTGYPTFRGPAGTSCTLIYDNTQQQTLTFNERGEVTLRPLSRTVIGITPNGGTPVTEAAPLILRGMVIDLNTYLN